MILTCPACSTRYFVDDASLGSAGRSVRCAACGHSWHAQPESALPGGAPPVRSAPASAHTPSAASPAETFGDVPAAVQDFAPSLGAPPEPAFEPEAPRAAPHTVFRARREEKKRQTRLALVGGAWGLTAAALVAGLVVTFIFRAEVVRLWPKSASAFALVGAPVNPFGLEFENVKLERQSIGGAPVLSISGRVRNVSERIQPARPIELRLLDHKNQKVFSWSVLPEQKNLKPGEAAQFLTRIANAPVEAMQMEVTLLDKAAHASKSGDAIALTHKRRVAAPAPEAALPPMAEPPLADALGDVVDEGTPFAGHGEDDATFDPLGAEPAVPAGARAVTMDTPPHG